ncbi:MAG: dephospho-CoA kinase [Prevotella sp.]|nr:dephospho-CoA kinase [Prevotella sp.]
MGKRRIAITGGIGSGKSYVCQLLGARGIQVYDCDAAAKQLMRTSRPLMDSLRQLVGSGVYDAGGRLQKRVLAEFLLASEENKRAVNDIVHPAVALDFEASGLEWLESAILFDSGFDRRVSFDSIVCVAAPLAVRIRRVMERDHISLAQALQWIHVQQPQREVISRSSHVVCNDGRSSLDSQLDLLLRAVGLA